jgi:hypothetical protein
MINHDKALTIKLPSALLNLIQEKADRLQIDRSRLIRHLIVVALEKDLPQSKSLKKHLRKIVPKKDTETGG